MNIKRIDGLKPQFIDVNQGHKVIIMGLKGVKGKANSENVLILTLQT